MLKTLSPQSVEHLRRTMLAMYTFAIKSDLYVGNNPAQLAERVKVPKKPVRFLDAAEVPRLLAAVPEQWRCLFATAIYTGARKGELLGLKASDVDLKRRTILLATSYDGPTKSAKPRTAPIPEELQPFLAAHLPTVKGEYLFGHDDGERRNRNTDLPAVFKRALARAGIVNGYDHICRRQGCGFRERRTEGEIKPCPKCSFRLWTRPIPADLRFHDLRSTFGTHAYEVTGDVRFVQTVLGHSAPTLTEERYSAVRAQRLVDQGNRLRFLTDEQLSALVTYPALTGSIRDESTVEVERKNPAGCAGFFGGVDGTRT
ncbi:MAG: site-specific integrase [Myxococcota bacterium]